MTHGAVQRDGGNAVGRQAVLGDGVRFDDFYETARVSMLKLAYFLTGSRSGAEEIVQEAFVQVLERWSRIDAPAAYTRVAVVNRSRSWRRRQIVARRGMQRLGHGDVHHDERDELIDILATLPRRRREVVVLRFYGQLSVPEIARALRVSEGTVKSSLHRGLAQVKEALR